jgi:hypothetical protein
VFEMGARQSPTVRRWRGTDAERAPDRDLPVGGRDGERTWAPLAADLLGTPSVEIADGPTIGSIATATAGFRDQFYGVAPFVDAAEGQPRRAIRLVTSGAVDLVNDLWSRRETRFAGRVIQSPVVDVDRMRVDAAELWSWATRVLVPKVVVATQTRVVELVVDETGEMWPSVPTIAVVAPREQLWQVAAALASPAVSAIGLARHAGAALASDAIKLSASQVLEMPLPVHGDAWRDGAAHLQAASAAAAMGEGTRWWSELDAFASAMTRAYDTSEDVREWWLARVPAFR